MTQGGQQVSPGQGLGERLRVWREQYAEGEEGEVGLTYRGLKDRLKEHLRATDTPSHVTLRDWENNPDPKPSANVLRSFERAFPELRLRWLLFGEGQPTKSGEEISEALRREGGRDAQLRREAFQRLGNLQALSPEVRHLFRRLVADWVQRTPDSGRVLDAEEDVRALTSAAGALERLIGLLFWYLGPWSRGGRDAETDPDEFETFFTSMIHALRPVLTTETRQERPLSEPGASPVVLLAEKLWYFQDELDELDEEGAS